MVQSCKRSLPKYILLENQPVGQKADTSFELVLCLTLLGLDNKHIAAVTGSSYHNVFVHSQKCLKTLGEDDDLYHVMESLMSQHQFAPSRG